jgi:aspartate kinase
MPSGIDTLSVIIDGSSHDENIIDRVVDGIRHICQPDIIEVDRNLALVAIVGHGMNRKKGTATKVFSCLYEADVNVRMIDQGSSELNIIVGIENKDYERTIDALYKAFLG